MPPIWGHFYHSDGGEQMQHKQIMKVILNEDGQGLVEYGLILSLVVVVVYSALYFLGRSVFDLFEVIKTEILNL